jgi:DNA repair exonuclease SbcCD ATPase subunit
MELKKTLFGGYRKSVVDSLINQWAEEEEKKLAQIELLENELRASKETAQKNMETMKTEADLKDQENLSLRKELSERQETLLGMEAKLLEQEAVITNVEGELDEHRKTRDRYEAGIRNIGQLYVDAKEYADSLKHKAQSETLLAIDRIFDEAMASEGLYTDITDQIRQSRQSIETRAKEMAQALQNIQDGLRDLDKNATRLSNPYEQIELMKSRLKESINSDLVTEDSNEKPLEDTYLKDDATSGDIESFQETQSEENFAEQAVKETLDQPNEYEKQLAELRDMIENQKEILEQMKTENIAVEKKDDKTDKKTIFAPEKDDYDRYFAEIEKKYLKNRDESFMIDLPPSDLR